MTDKSFIIKINKTKYIKTKFEILFNIFNGKIMWMDRWKYGKAPFSFDWGSDN